MTPLAVAVRSALHWLRPGHSIRAAWSLDGTRPANYCDRCDRSWEVGEKPLIRPGSSNGGAS